MITVILDNGVKHSIVTQQYEVGLYVIEDSDPHKQYGLDIEEAEFHKQLREQYEYIKEESTEL